MLNTRTFFFGGLITGLVLGIFGVRIVTQTTQAENDVESMAIGGRAPEFSSKSLDNQEIHLADYSGKIIILNFWASWCEPCRLEMPVLQKFSDLYPNKLVVVGINSSDSTMEMSSFASTYRIDFPLLVDHSNAIADKYFIRGIPTTFFLDENHTIVATHISELSELDMQKYLTMMGVIP